MNDQAVAEEYRCSVQEARRLPWAEYHFALCLLEGKNIAERSRQRAEERKQKQQRRG
jgi:hypothetical protein